MKKTIFNYKKTSTQQGFTLVELIVSLGLFVVVIIAAVGSLYSVNNAARKVEAMRTVLDNLNFAIESMSRTIRTGTDVVCGSGVQSSQNNCSFSATFNNPAEEISIQSTLGTQGLVRYRWVDVGGRGEIQKWSDGDWVSLTAPGIDIQQASFFVDGANSPITGGDDAIQPSVMMLIQGVATAGENTAPFAIQTLVSVRTVE